MRLEVKLWGFIDQDLFGSLSELLNRLETNAGKIYTACTTESKEKAEKSIRKCCKMPTVGLEPFTEEILGVMNDVRWFFTAAKMLYSSNVYWKFAVLREIREMDCVIREVRTKALSEMQTDLHSAKGDKKLADSIYHAAMQPGSTILASLIL